MSRRSPIWLLVCLLTLATGLTLLGLGTLATAPPPRSVSPATHASDALVLSFYAAVNATLRSGDATGLAPLLAADFVEHNAPPGLPPTRTGFAQHVVALHATHPVLRLAAEDVTTQGDVVVVHVRLEGETSDPDLSPSDQSSLWGETDVFRTAAGRIAEHWGGPEHAAVLEALQQAPFAVPSAATQTLSLTHTTAAPGGRFDIITDLGPEAISVEAGRLTVMVASGPLGSRSSAGGSRPPERVEIGVETTLRPGDLWLLPEGVHSMIRNDDVTAATFLTIALRRPEGFIASKPLSTSIPTAAPTPTGMIAITYASCSLIALRSGPATLGLGRATLAPGSTRPVDATGAAIFLVETGTLDLAAVNGAIWSSLPSDGTKTAAVNGILGPGDAVAIGPGGRGELRNATAAPLFLRVITITPAPDAGR